MPDFLIEARSIPRAYWTDSQIEGWISRAQVYLSDGSARGDRGREDVYVAYADWEWILDSPGVGQALRVINDYFQEFPSGELQDEMAWMRVRFENHVFKYDERSAQEPVDVARAFEAHLSSRPDTRMADEIHLQLGLAYHTAYEILSYFPDDNPDLAGQRDSFHGKAHEMFRQAVLSEDPEITERAMYLLNKENIFFVAPPQREEGRGPNP